MVNPYQIHILRQNLRHAIRDVLLSNLQLAPDLRRNFDGSPAAQAQVRAEHLADATLIALMQDETGIFVTDLQARVADPAFKESLALRFASFKGSPRFSTSQPNNEAVTSMVDGVHTALKDLNVLASGEILGQATAPIVAKPVKLPKPKAILSGEAGQSTAIDMEALRATIKHFFATQEVVNTNTKGGRPVFGTTLDQRVNGLTNAALQALAPNVGGTVGGWKATVTKMARPDSTLTLCLHDELEKHRGIHSPQLYKPASEGGKVNEVPLVLVEKLCAHLQQWIKVEHVAATAIDPKAPEAAALADKIAGKDKPGRSAA